MKFLRFGLSGILFFTLCRPILSQINTTPYIINLKYHYGFVMKHSINMAHLANQRPQGLEIDLYKQTTGIKNWQCYHNFPMIGYSFQYFHLDPKKPLGDMYSAIIYYSQKFLKSKKTFFSYRIGMGAGYVERRFDLKTNYYNNLISSRINYALNGRLSFTWKIQPKVILSTGIGILHFSNGAMKVPNLGINIPSFHIGLGIYLDKTEDSVYIGDHSDIWFDTGTRRAYGEYHIYANLAGGFKQVYPVEGKSWPISTLSLYTSKHVNHRSELSIGTDVFYDGSNKVALDTLPNPKNIKYFKWGINIGHEYLIDRVSLLTQFGVYLYDPLRLDKRIYQRVALKYSLPHTPLFLSMGLKTHLGQADFVEWGVGIKL
ncbi:MAG: acyloxyacyl hydrolase [Cytophagaceae bacterium]|nr:acyloxyacyl hydrolase [Cytophagaceae bacterium]